MPRASFTQRTADHFKSHPFVWIDAIDLQIIGGRFAFRTRVSECRTKFGMHIVNELRQRKTADGTIYTRSLYQYRPYEPLGRPADVPTTQQPGLFP